MHYNERPIFQFSKFKFFDIFLIVLYAIVTIIVSLYLREPNEIDDKVEFVSLYAFATHFLIYTFGYKSLRNMKVLLVWIFFGLIHLLFFYFLKYETELTYSNIKTLNSLRNTIPFLFFFQFLRFVSLKIQHQELVCPSRGRTDLFDGRETNLLDLFLTLLYLGSVIFMYTYK